MISNAATKDVGLLVLRIGIGLLMLFPHGYAKVVGFTQYMDKFADPIGLGSTFSLVLTVFAEVVCSILIMLGIKTRIFATPLLITMLVAAFIVHASDPWKVKEKAILFALGYLVIVITGGGKYSVRD